VGLKLNVKLANALVCSARARNTAREARALPKRPVTRLTLCDVTSRVLKQGLDTLGIEVLEQMKTKLSGSIYNFDYCFHHGCN